jgi:hypothetical protein
MIDKLIDETNAFIQYMKERIADIDQQQAELDASKRLSPKGWQ